MAKISNSKKSRKIFIGTSGWTYDDWSGPFYPPEVKGADRLPFYTKHFNTVEVNATFYRLPFQGMIDGWNKKLGPDFHLVVKGSRVVTHFKKLEDIKEPLKLFFDRVLQLKTLKIILWQLPPSLHKDVKRLDKFLSKLPKTVRHAVEFRHKSWWDDQVTKVLSKHKVAFVAISHPTLPDDIIATTDFLYVRFHGMERQLYRYDYTDKELKDWARRLKPHLKGRTLYVFFNNDYNANAPRNAKTLKKLL